MLCHHIMAVIVEKRSDFAKEVQNILTSNGKIIKMRLGLHEISHELTEQGLILLQLAGTNEEIKKVESEINNLNGVSAQTMELCLR